MNKNVVGAVILALVLLLAGFGVGRATADEEEATTPRVEEEAEAPAMSVTCQQALSVAERLSEEAVSAMALARATSSQTSETPGPPAEALAERSARVQVLARQVQESTTSCEASLRLGANTTETSAPE